MPAKDKKKTEELLLFKINSGEENEKTDRKEQIEEMTEDVSRMLTGPEFVRMEKNIAAFGFFTPTSKRAKDAPPKVIRFSHIIDGNRAEAKVTIAGNTLYGMPTTADQDKYLAFQKILERIKREKGKIENPIAFTSAELLQLLGHSDGGANFKDVEEWCDVMASTYIKSEGAMWIAGRKKFASDSFVIFQRVRRTGQELDDGTTADRNYIWLSDWYLENINAYYLLPIDFDTYKQLRNNIAKALIPLLQVWLYASREQGIFEKRYDEICQILNITQYTYPSKIKEKLSPSLNELIQQEYLTDWAVAETADKTGYKILFWHGRKFYQDQGKRLQKANKIRKNLNSGKDKKDRKYHLPPGSKDVFNRLRNEFDVTEIKALELVRNFPVEKIKSQMDSFVFRREPVKNMSGFIIRAIENDYSLPEGYSDILNTRKRTEAEKNRREAIAVCEFCDGSGQRNVKSDFDPLYGVLHECTHDPKFEGRFEDHKFE